MTGPSQSPTTDVPPARDLEELPLVEMLADCCTRLDAAPIAEAEAVTAAAVFAALAHPVRVQLVSLIGSAAGGEACVCDLVDAFELSQPTVSHHLGKLLDAGLVERERRGSWAYYRLRPGALASVAAVLAPSA